MAPVLDHVGEYSKRAPLLLCGVLGCGSPGDHYRIQFDPTGATVQDLELGVAAVDMWLAGTPDLRADVVIGPCSGAHPAMGCIHFSTGAVVSGYSGSGTSLGITRRGFDVPELLAGFVDGGETWIAVDRIAAQYPTERSVWLEQVVAHELGHVMRLEHPNNTNSGELMNAWADQPTLTCADVAQWYAIRGRKGPTPCE